MEKWRAKGDEKNGAGLMIGKNAESFSEIVGVGTKQFADEQIQNREH